MAESKNLLITGSISFEYDYDRDVSGATFNVEEIK